jgi:predicted regulator of Ras-like GTPase activity (Roadblock/LC7/MglB family)
MSPAAKTHPEHPPQPQLVSKKLRSKAGLLLKLFVEKFGGVGVKNAIISTADGFDVAVEAMSAEEGAKLSALSSSISAIGQMAVKEVGAGERHQSIAIESDEGYIFIMDIHYPGCPLILSITASKEAMLGKLIYYAKQVVAKMSEA